MVRDIPDYQDFYGHGIDLLNVSWDMTMELLTRADDARNWDSPIDDIFDEYLDSAESTLKSAMSTALQGVEICLKGKICEISPYLLLYGNPNDWPTLCGVRPIRFI